MASGFERGLQIIELLAGEAEGLPLHLIADTLNMPRSAAHRLLAELIDAGFVYQRGELGNYALGLKLPALGLKHLAANDLVTISQPLLEDLANTHRELVRLAMVDADRESIIWVAQAQGSKSGLRYDPEAGATARLSCSATGMAWISFMPEEEAFARVLKQGIGSREDYGPEAPETLEELRVEMEATRERGYAVRINTHTAGLGSVAVPVYDADGVAGVLSLSGPTARLTSKRLHELSAPLLEAAEQLSLSFKQSAGRLTGPAARLKAPKLID